MDRSKLPPDAQKALDGLEAKLKADYEAKKAAVEAAATRRPWTVVAWSAAAGAVAMVGVLKFLSVF
ncbi:hypothetical protein D3C87_1514520 [compost metagenome]